MLFFFSRQRLFVLKPVVVLKEGVGQHRECEGAAAAALLQPRPHFIQQSQPQSQSHQFRRRANSVNVCLGTMLTARFASEACSVSQHAPVHPCLPHSLAAARHPQREAVQFQLPASLGFFSFFFNTFRDLSRPSHTEGK